MPILPQFLENLASLGANLELSESGYVPNTLEKLVSIVRSRGGHITINVNGAMPVNLENLAKIGGNHITFRF